MKLIELFRLNRLKSTKLKKLLDQEIGKCPMLITDESYTLKSKEDIELFLEKDDTDKMDYVSILFDCDDFAIRLLGSFKVPGWSNTCLGILIIGYENEEDYHALNVFVDLKKDVYIIEPQTDVIYPAKKYLKDHKSHPIFVLFM
jgi:hypothetical protein